MLESIKRYVSNNFSSLIVEYLKKDIEMKKLKNTEKVKSIEEFDSMLKKSN